MANGLVAGGNHTALLFFVLCRDADYSAGPSYKSCFCCINIYCGAEYSQTIAQKILPPVFDHIFTALCIGSRGFNAGFDDYKIPSNLLYS